MSEKSNETLEEMITNLHKDVKEIKVQTTKTNGRVSRLETWRGFITGGITILGLIVIPLLIYFIEQL